jgi:hypothetical protein
MNWSDYSNFSAQEFNCSHCNANEMKPEFMAKLQKLRETYGSPMRVTSGYRCPQHPIEAKKARAWRTRKRSGSRHRGTGVRCTHAPQNGLRSGFYRDRSPAEGYRQVSTLGHARKRFTPYRVVILGSPQ